MNKIKTICCSCSKKFKNSKARYNQAGNYCLKCCRKIELMMQWRQLKHKNSLTRKQAEKMADLQRIIWWEYNIEMEKNDLAFQGFKNNLKAVLNLN